MPEKGFEGILWFSNNEKFMTDSMCTVQDCQTCSSVQPSQKTESPGLGLQMTKLSTTPNSPLAAESYRLWITCTVNNQLLLNIDSLVGS